MPGPALVSAPVPVIAEASVTLLPLVSKVPPPAPSAVRRGEMSVLVPAAHCRPPPLSVIAPEPKLPADAKLTRPPVMVVPPL